MGEVYLARDLKLGRRVAIKTLRLRSGASTDDRARFQQLFGRDAASTARLNHPDIVSIHHVGTHLEMPYLVLEFIDGKALDELLVARGAFSESDVLRIGKRLCDALAYAHRRGVVHRDIKPSNLMLTRGGGLKVLDFGIAFLRVAREELEEAFGASSGDLGRRLGGEPLAAGTPAYMAPEQLKAAQDHRVDIWATGMVLYELLTGHQPTGHLAAPLDGRDLVWPPKCGVSLPTRKAVARCLRRAPEERFASMEDLRCALEALQDASGPMPIVPAEAPSSPQHALGRFIGREHELLWLDRHGRQTPYRLCVVVGPGGVGKTRLIQEWVRQSLEIDALASSCFISLADATTRDDVLQACAQALEIAPVGDGALEQLVAAFTRRAGAVIVLDNCEQVTGAVTEIATACASQPEPPRLVVTSRQALQLPGACVLDLQPFSDTDEAVALYSARAREAMPGWSCPPAQLPALRQLVLQLDGLPLAIELAAARASVLPPEAMLARMDRRLAMLRSNGDGSTSRHRTLHAAIEWSWRLLDRAGRSTLVQLGVFESPFSLDAAEDVVDLSHHEDATYVVDAIDSLIRASLLRLDTRGERYEMLTSVRAFAREHGRHDQALQERHLRWCSARARHINDASRRGIAVPSVAPLAADLDAASAWALKPEQPRRLQKAGVECIAALATGLLQYGPFSAAARLMGRLADGDDIGGAAASFAWGQIGDALLQTGRRDDAIRATETALALARQDGDGLLEARWQGQLGALYARSGQRDQGLQHLREAVDKAKLAGDIRLACRCLNAMAAIEQMTGGAQQSAKLYEQALALASQLGDATVRSRILGNLGTLHSTLGRHEQARLHLEQALEIAREQGDTAFALVWLGNLAEPLAQLGDQQSAVAVLDEAITMARELGARSYEGAWLSVLASMTLNDGRLDEARRLYEDALEIATERGDSLAAAEAEAGLARCALGRGRREDAVRRYHAACTMLEAGDGGPASAPATAVRDLAASLGLVPPARIANRQ